MFLKRLNLLQKFSILSLLGIGILILVLGYTISYFLARNILDREWTTLAQVVRSQVEEHSLYPLFSSPSLPTEQRRYEELISPLKRIPEIRRIKVYDKTGTLVWSDEPRLFGQAFSENEELKRALRGKIGVKLTKLEKAENIYEREKFGVLAEVYIPIFYPGGHQVIGVIEAYKDPASLLQTIRRGKLWIWSVSLGGGLLLYLSLFWIVRTSHRSQLRLEGDVRKYSRDLENKINILEELYRISLAMQEPMTLNERLDFILKGAHEVLGLDRINILLPDKEIKMLHCMASVGNIDEPLDRIKAPLDERGGALAIAFKEKREIHWDGNGPVPEGLKLHYPYSEIKAFRSRNFLVLPLVSRRKAIGVVGADNKFSRKAFSQETIELLTVFASQAAIAIENATLFEKERQKVQESRAIMEIQREILEELDLERLLTLIIRKASELLKAHSGAVYLYDEAHQVFRPKAWHNMGEWIRDVEIPLGRGVTGTSVLEKRGIIANDYPNSPYAIPAFIEHSIQAAIAQPLIIKDKIIGVITINDANIGRVFTQDDLGVLGIFANHVGIAIENARLYQELKEYSSSLEEKVRERTMELEEANLKLERASRHKSEFLANMSHELRTPLNSILGFSELLIDKKFGELNERQSRYVGNILISGKHLLQLINDILDISKVEAGRMELKPQEFSLAQALEDSLIIIRPQANRKNLSLDLEMEGNISITADPLRFRQIMYNLLSNAVKFTPDGGQVRVTARVRSPMSEVRGQEDIAVAYPQADFDDTRLRTPDYGPFVEISVLDTGIGIKKEDQERVFLPFQQVDGSLARRFEGTGLGLALTRQLVEMHGGRIWVESEGEGKGSRFSFLLPLFT